MRKYGSPEPVEDVDRFEDEGGSVPDDNGEDLVVDPNAEPDE